MFAATALRRTAARWPIHLVNTAEQSRAVVERILSAGHTSVGVDCEGERLGRFGRLSLVQLATEREVFLLDIAVGGPKLVEPLASLLGSPEPIKVFHDCREDASVLLNQYSVALNSVFDTQIGHAVWLERQNLEPYQASVAEVLRTFLLGTYKKHRWSDLERRPIMPERWRQRPLDPEVVRYAVEGVAHLVNLQRAICRELGDPSGDLVLRRSVRYTEYAHMNRAELPSADINGLRPGVQLEAMLAARRPDSAYFKLNHGLLTGAVLDASDLRDFTDMQLGDVVLCRAKSVSDCRQFVHLQREGHGRLFFDRKLQEMRTLPSREEVDAEHPRRQSSLYGLGKSRGNRPAIQEEPSTYKAQKPEVIYKAGKRGQVKVRRSGFRPAQRQSQAGAASDPFEDWAR